MVVVSRGGGGRGGGRRGECNFGYGDWVTWWWWVHL